MSPNATWYVPYSKPISIIVWRGVQTQLTVSTVGGCALLTLFMYFLSPLMLTQVPKSKMLHCFHGSLVVMARVDDSLVSEECHIPSATNIYQVNFSYHTHTHTHTHTRTRTHTHTHTHAHTHTHTRTHTRTHTHTHAHTDNELRRPIPRDGEIHQCQISSRTIYRIWYVTQSWQLHEIF